MRDRDSSGRPRNARPRDETGRPLARDAVGVPPLEDRELTPIDALHAAQVALDAGQPFAAHEHLEGAWKRAAEAERDFWQGMAQLAVGLTHLQRGNAKGAEQLLLRGAERLSPYAGSQPHGVDVDALRATATRLAVAVANGDVGELPRLTLIGDAGG